MITERSMRDEQEPSKPPAGQLIEYQLWERLERRLWARARLLLGVVIIALLAFVLLGLPLIRHRIEDTLFERSRHEIAEQVAAVKADLPQVRQEIRDDTGALREQLIKGQVELDLRLAGLLKQADEVERAFKQIESGRDKLKGLEDEAAALQNNLLQENKRLEQLRTRQEIEFKQFKKDGEAMRQTLPQSIQEEFGRIEGVVERDLDELRQILADHAAGNPAMFSTFVDVEQHSGAVLGTNFGDTTGRVFMRVRIYPPTGDKPLSESESLLVPAASWTDDRIDLRLSSTLVERLEGVKAAAGTGGGAPSRVRYGFLIQTAEGKLSRWSGKSADSLVPPTRGQAPETP